MYVAIQHIYLNKRRTTIIKVQLGWMEGINRTWKVQLHQKTELDSSYVPHKNRITAAVHWYRKVIFRRQVLQVNVKGSEELFLD